MTRESNPFSTRCVRPGQLEYKFPAGLTVWHLVKRLEQHAWWGQIVGPHGVGKSTLLHSLMPALAAAERSVAWWTLPGGQRHWPAGMAAGAKAWDESTLVVVDGYEQLSRWARWRLHRRCRKAGAGLLITTHRDAGFPTLATISCPLPTVQQLVAQLLRGDPLVISPDEVSTCYVTQGGNVREVFFALYDLYEQRRHAAQKPPSLPTPQDVEP